MASFGSKAEEVYIWLLKYIDKNRFSSNLSLPSENAVCRRLGVSRNTVRTAMERLEQENLIERVRGSGTFIKANAALSRTIDTGKGTCRIALILQGQDNDANKSLLSGVKKIVQEKNADLHVFLTDNKYCNERRCLEVVTCQDYQGFIIDGVKASLVSPNMDCYKRIYSKRIPVIFFNNYYKEMPYPKVVVNDKICAELLMNLLLKAGHKNIAGIFLYDNYQSIEKFRGMMWALHKHGINLNDDNIKWCISTEAHDETFIRPIEKFIRSVSGCTAIVCCNYMLYELVRKALKRMDKKVPEDYSVICFDYSAGNFKEENVTCSVQQGLVIGEEVAARLFRMMEQKKCDDSFSMTIPPQIHVGETIKDISNSSNKSYK